MSDEIKYTYGQFTPDHLQKIRDGILLFNQQKYWECHEELEHWWLEDVADHARNVYWAVIQVAASLIHYRDGKIVGASSLINKAKEKLRRCETLQVETKLLYDELSWKEFKALVDAVPSAPELKDFAQLYEFRFEKF